MGYIVIGNQTILVTIVVIICKTTSPGLAFVLHSPCFSFIDKNTIALVDKKHVVPSRIFPLGDTKLTLSDVKIHVSIIVDISPFTAIIT